MTLLFIAAESLAPQSLEAFDPSTPGAWPTEAGNVQMAITEASFVQMTDRSGKVGEAGSASKPIPIDLIFPVMFTLYGSLGLLWIFFYRVPQWKENKLVKILLLCTTWCGMSVGMHTLNKALSVLLGTPSLIALSQMAVSVVIFGAMSWRDLLQADRKELLTWMIVPIFFASMLISSFYTYEYISLSMLTIVRNLTPLVVLPIESLVMPADKQPRVDRTIVLSILAMFFGAVIYGGNIENFSWIGIAFALMNMILACSDRLIQRRLLTDQCKGLTSSACSILNNGVAMFPTFAMALMTQETTKVTSPEAIANWTDPQTMILLAMSGLIGMGICYFGFECQREVSATSFFVMQNLSKVAVVTVGISVFGDSLRSPWALLGLLLSLGGSFAYGRAQMPSIPSKPGETERLVPEGSDKKLTA